MRAWLALTLLILSCLWIKPLEERDHRDSRYAPIDNLFIAPVNFQENNRPTVKYGGYAAVFSSKSSLPEWRFEHRAVLRSAVVDFIRRRFILFRALLL